MNLPDFFSLRERLLGHLGRGDHDSSRASEAVRRLEQLEWILVRCRALEAMAVTLGDDRDAAGVTTGRQEAAAVLEMQILVESFYFFAWRLIEMLDHWDEPVRGLRKMKDRCKGILNVRNHLLEHPEKKSHVFEQSFSYGDPEGPKVKSIRFTLDASAPGPPASYELRVADESNHSWVDCGLYVNAAELAAALDARLPASPAGILELPPRARA